MRSFLILTLAVSLLATLSSAGEDKEKAMIKKWMMHKAMESCFGEDNMKKFMVHLKSAAAKCAGVDAPELDLPIFRNPIRYEQNCPHLLLEF